MPQRTRTKTSPEARAEVAGAPVTLALRAEWGEALDATPIQFSDQIIASYRGDYVLVAFGQVAQPQFQPGDLSAVTRAKERGTLPIQTQFRAAVPATTFAEFVRSVVKVARTQGIPLSGEEGDDDDRED